MNISTNEFASTLNKAIQQAVQNGYSIVFDQVNDIPNKRVDPLVSIAFYLKEYKDLEEFQDEDGEFSSWEVARYLEKQIQLTEPDILEFDRGCIGQGSGGPIWATAKEVCESITQLSKSTYDAND